MAYSNVFGGGVFGGSAPVDPATYMYESEEERRRRLEAERLRAANLGAPTPAPVATAPAQPTPIKETITTDPITGERKIKIEGSERDLSAMNPRTPTMTPAAPAPAAPVNPDQFRFENLTPDQITGLEQRMGEMGINDRGILRRPDAAEMFNARPVDQRERVFQAINQPAAQPGGMLRTSAPAAAPTAAPAAAPPVAPMAPAAEQPALGTSITPSAQQFDYNNLLTGAAANDRVRSRLINDPTTPPDVRRAAMTLETENLQRQKQQAELTKRVPELLQNPRTLAAELTKKGEEGSLLKALFYKSLGMTNLALEEEKKLGAGAKWQSAVSPDGTSQALIRYNADGLPIAGFDSSGNALEPQQLAQYAAGGLAGNIDIVGGTYVNDTTGEVGRVVTDKRTGRSMIQTGKGIIPLGAGWRPQSSAGSLADQRTRMLQELNLKLVGKTAEEAMAILRPYNQALAGQGLPIIQPSELNIQAPQIGNGAAPAAGPVAPPAAAPAAPAAATSVAPPPTTTPAATSVAPPVTTGAAPALTPTTPNLSPVAAPMAATAGPAAGGRPTMSQLQAQAAGAETEAKATAEDVAKAKMNAGKINEQVDTLNELSNQLLQHPGFSVSVGASAQPGFQFIPGTDKATFYSLFNQIKGQAFLSAIESLKGMGALSDREGAAATAAVTALSLDMNEKDFRKASHQLVSQMRRYADRNARKAGQPLPYNEPDLATQTRENRQAQTWLKSARVGGKNPDGTPITQQQIDGVRQRLWQRGEID